ncbi:MAG: amidohydrolase [Dehalococcoidia bacterium]|uniref:M20 metallopeptidase family protein n=1 Tax=Candidatus Amarobacter glycogenicus TaxID=3140699 RepID=UPI0031363917|nr:amidohydrolase [Dehalococcoidia bacterium]MBK9343286.1 amidohydrolase [Dehalococcoidia bacterium]MBK9545060.1 amidohydrolase [Dehalococcoidia bacterium]
MPRSSRLHLRPDVQALRERVLSTRRDFHQHPELSWHEQRTQGVILERLRSLGVAEVRPIARTGVTGLVKGGQPGRCVLWRADMDALPVPEKSSLSFASQNENVMHACGHDAHMAIGLGLAEVLQQRREDLAGSVRFVFQPAEEAAGGAQACIADGVLDSPHVDVALGLHISADIPLGAINVAPGPFFAAPTAFRITIEGRGGHAAAPHQSIDAVVVAAYVITALQTVVSRSMPPAETAVLTVGKIAGGYRGNVIAESATMTGTIRSYTDAVRETMLRRTEEIVAGVCASFGATYEFDHQTSCPPLVNDPGVAEFVRAAGIQYFGEANILAAPTMGAEDMGVFLEKRPGCYFWLGARNERKGIAGRHHDPAFVIDEDALLVGVEFGLRLIEGQLAR